MSAESGHGKTKLCDISFHDAPWRTFILTRLGDQVELYTDGGYVMLTASNVDEIIAALQEARKVLVT